MGRSKRNRINGFKYEHPIEEIEMKPKIFIDTIDGLRLVTSPVPLLDYERVREIIRPSPIIKNQDGNLSFNSQLLN